MKKITTSAPTLTKTRIRLTEKQKAAIIVPQDLGKLIVGMILGDSSLESRNKKARMQIKQSDPLFVNYLYSQFKPTGLVTAVPINSHSMCKGKLFNSYRFCTITHPSFRELHSQ
jgi:hypothetical protein